MPLWVVVGKVCWRGAQPQPIGGQQRPGDQGAVGQITNPEYQIKTILDESYMVVRERQIHRYLGIGSYTVGEALGQGIDTKEATNKLREQSRD